MRIVIREDTDGHLYYDNDATTVELLQNERASESLPPGREPSAGAAEIEKLSKNRLAQWIKSVKDSPVSKVVDENGEPLVVYHGTTDNTIEAFKPKLTGRQSGNRYKGGAVFFDNILFVNTFFCQFFDLHPVLLSEHRHTLRCSLPCQVLQSFQRTFESIIHQLWRTSRPFFLVIYLQYTDNCLYIRAG